MDLLNQKKTKDLENQLENTKSSEMHTFFSENNDELYKNQITFSEYMKTVISSKKLKQNRVLIQADIPEGYGRKILSMEKRTTKRDVILRIMIAAGFSCEEAERALKLYRMTPLYVKIPRDAVIMQALFSKVNDVEIVNERLKKHGFEPLAECGEKD